MAQLRCAILAVAALASVGCGSAAEVPVQVVAPDPLPAAPVPIARIPEDPSVLDPHPPLPPDSAAERDHLLHILRTGARDEQLRARGRLRKQFGHDPVVVAVLGPPLDAAAMHEKRALLELLRTGTEDERARAAERLADPEYAAWP